MLVKILGMTVGCIAIGLAIAIAPEYLGSGGKSTPQISRAEYQRLVGNCVDEVEKKLKSMGPFFKANPEKVRKKCEVAVDSRVNVSN